jgi:hypothetical protein
MQLKLRITGFEETDTFKDDWLVARSDIVNSTLKIIFKNLGMRKSEELWLFMFFRKSRSYFYSSMEFKI